MRIIFLALRNIAMPDPTFLIMFSICLSHFSFSSDKTPIYVEHDRIIVDRLLQRVI